MHISKLEVTASGNFTNLSDIVNPVNIHLLDADTDIEMASTVTLSGNTIIFDSLSNLIAQDTIKNIKVVLGSTLNLEANYGKNLQLIASGDGINQT